MNPLETVKSFYSILGSEGLVALNYVRPSAHWTEMFPGYEGTLVGPEEIRRKLFEPLARDWQEFAVTPDAFVVQGPVVVAFGTYTGTYKATGKSLAAPFVHRWDIVDGAIESFRQYTDTALIARTRV
jgi:ketosteroid isomerase-like protein